MLKYVFDKDGNKTDIIIPIEKWNDMQYSQLPIIDHNPLYIENKSDLPFSTEHHFKIYLQEHYKQIIELINKKDDLTKEEWLTIYDEYFKYYNILNENDINLLFFIRKETLPNFSQLDFDIITKQLNGELSNKYDLKSIYYSAKIAHYQYKIIANNLMTMNEYSFLQFFKTNYKMSFPNSSIKRLQRLPDRNRLFIYDLITIHEKYLNEAFCKKNYEFFKSKKNIISFIANYLYNSQETQVYRLLQEAQERIEKL